MRTGIDEAPAAGGSLVARLRRNHLVSNSLYLMLNSGLQAAAGFLFWVIGTHLFDVADVGLATGLFSALGVIAFTALLGLNSTLVRFLPQSRERSVLVTSSLAVGALCAVALAVGYLALVPVVSSKLSFVTHNPAMAVGFVLLAVAGVWNLLTDSVFIGLRQARYNALIDGGIGGVTKLVAAVVVAGAGAYGLFLASCVGYVAAALASMVVLVMVEKLRPSLRGARHVLAPLARFSGANFVGNLLTLLPTFVIPIIVLDRVGVHASAYYYIAFQMVNLLFAAVYAVEQTFLAEGSHEGVDLRDVMRRSWRLLALFCVPATAALIIGARWLLLLFGRDYSAHGTDVLIVLAVSALPLAAFYWFLTVLRLIGHLRPIVVGNALFAVSTCGLAWVLAPHGVVALSLAWPIGLTAAAVITGVPVLRWVRTSA